jgi:hypothetical protein
MFRCFIFDSTFNRHLSKLSTCFSNSTLRFDINSNSTSNVDANLVGFKQPIHGLDGQFLLTNMNLSILSIWKQHLQNVIKMPTIEKYALS